MLLYVALYLLLFVLLKFVALLLFLIGLNLNLEQFLLLE